MNINKLQILIVEDDPLYAVELQMLVEEIGYDVLSVVESSGEALDLIFSESPDLILMDIGIKGRLNGIEVGVKVKSLNIPILYITSFDNETYHRKASQSNMVGYLVKPLSKYSIQSAISLAMQNVSAGQGEKHNHKEKADNFFLNDYFFFKKRQIYQKVAIHDFCIVEADGDYINVYTDAGEKYVARMAMSQIESQLPPDTFFRVHRSYIINLTKITSVNFSENILESGGKFVPISKSKKKEFSKRINKLN